MIKEHRRLNVQDLSNRGNDMSLEINWNNSKDVKNCKYIRVRLGEGPEAIVKRDHLFELLMLLADDKQQDRMTSNYMTYSRLKNYRTVIDIELQKDKQKGEILAVPLTISIDEEKQTVSVKP